MAKLRWGLLSTARINERLIDAIARSQHSKVTAVGSRDAKRAAAYADQHGIPHAYGSYAELVGSQQVDVVYISSPNDQHTEWGLEAARSSKHALIEKPLALTGDDVVLLLKAAEENATVIQEASMMRFHDQTAYVRSLVAGGHIGEPRFALGSFSFTLQHPGDIRFDSNGGGSLWDLGVYPITFFQTVLKRRPTSVLGIGVNRGTDVDMTFSGIIQYEGGILGHLTTSMESVPSWSAEIVGSSGRIKIAYPWLSHLNVTSFVELTAASSASMSTFGDGVENLVTTQRQFADVNAYRDEVAAMEAMIIEGIDPVFPLTESRVNIETVTSLLESARLGSRVDVKL